jgi:hypothetical protein
MECITRKSDNIIYVNGEQYFHKYINFISLMQYVDVAEST